MACNGDTFTFRKQSYVKKDLAILQQLEGLLGINTLGYSKIV